MSKRRPVMSMGEVRDLDPRVVAVLTTVRQSGRVALAVRAAALLGAAVAVIATTTPGWDSPDGYILVAVIAGLVAVVRPDSAGALVCSVAVAVTWSTGASGDVTPATAAAAVGLLVLHASCALGAAAPMTAVIDPAVVAAWWRPVAAIAGATVLTAGVTAGLTAWSPPGSIVLTLAAIAAVTAVVWWVARPDR